MKARFTPALFAHAEAVLGELLHFAHPADAVVSRYFREHRQLGHADRAFVAETVFAVLRRWRSLAARCGERRGPRALLLAALTTVRGWSQRELAPVLKASEQEWLAGVKAEAKAGAGVKVHAEPESAAGWPPAVACDLPDWLYDRLAAQFGAEAVPELARALNQPAPLDLRVNPLKTDREALLAALAADGIAAEAGTLSPLAVRLRDKPALARHPLFLAGHFEVQDEGSQLLGFLLEPRRGEMVADFCAGAGGKTLLLGALMKNTGRLYAFDVSDKRLANLKPRLARSGLSNVHPARIEHERDLKIKRLAGKMDRVLVDAPCSGLGTLRRNPDLKWRQSEAAVAELNGKQAAILAAAATLVRPGGRLVYATCSLLTAENEGIVEAFLAQHPDFSLLPAGEILARQSIALDGDMLCLRPDRQPPDGLFAAALLRRNYTAMTPPHPALTLLAELWADFGSPDFLWQVLALATSLGLAFLFARWWRGRRAEGAGRLSDASARLAFPLSGMLLVGTVRLALKPFVHVNLLKLALSLLGALALVRSVVFVLRQAFPRATWLTAWERIIATLVWGWLALYITDLAPYVIDALEDVQFRLGKQVINLWMLLHGAVTVFLTVVLALWVAGMVEQRLMRVEAIDSSLRIVGVRVAKALLTVAALITSLSLVGIDMTALSVFTGALGVGLGFGLQKIASNYVSGFIILLDRSIRLGNIVQVGADSGEVTQITTRYTVLKHPGGTEFIVPNETLIGTTVQNHTFSDRRVRVATTVGVAYDTDLDLACQLLIEAATHQPRVLSDPPPRVALTRFGDSAIDLELGFWIDDPEAGRGNVLSDVNFALWRAFRAHGIVIPFPQREVRLLP